MIDFETWYCKECYTEQVDLDNNIPVTPEPPHAGFCPVCGPTIVELIHRCDLPQDHEAYPWKCDVCGITLDVDKPNKDSNEPN